MHTRWPSLGNYPNNRASCFNLQSSALENNYSMQADGHMSFTLRGQRPTSNLDVNILCGLDEPSPAHARPLVKRPGKSWSSGLALMMSRGAVFLLPRESSSCQCWHFCGRLSLSHLRTNIRASVKQSLPALKGRMDLRGAMPQKIQQEAFQCSEEQEHTWQRTPRASPQNGPASLHEDGYEWQRTVFTPRIGQLSCQRKLVFLKWQSLR